MPLGECGVLKALYEGCCFCVPERGAGGTGGGAARARKGSRCIAPHKYKCSARLRSDCMSQAAGQCAGRLEQADPVERRRPSGADRNRFIGRCRIAGRSAGRGEGVTRDCASIVN